MVEEKKEKQIHLRKTGGGTEELLDITIRKGSTLADVKRAMGLKEDDKTFAYFRGNNEQIAEGVDLFALLKEHEKIVATPVDPFGGGIIFSFFDNLIGPQKVTITRRSTVPSRISTPHLVMSRRSLIAEPIENCSPREQLIAMGFRSGQAQDSLVYRYLSKRGQSYDIKAEEIWSRRWEIGLRYPPADFMFTHGLCFIPRGEGWYAIHFERHQPPADLVRNTISAIENAEDAAAWCGNGFNRWWA
jgi:hypothetical protein